MPPVEKAIKRAAMTQDDPLLPLDASPDAHRIRTRRMVGGVASIVADASDLSVDERAALEARLKAAALAIDGIRDVRIALTASRRGRTIMQSDQARRGRQIRR